MSVNALISHPASKWLLLLALAGGVTLWGLSGNDTPDEAPAPEPALTAASAVTSEASAPVAGAPDSPPSPQEVATLIAEQVSTQQVMEDNPTPAPTKGTVRERPEFVSAMEWSVLQEMANNSPDPNATLTRLVNALRFTKQLETWQQLLADQKDAPKRQRIAQALLSDLPQRVEMGDYTLESAQQLQDQLLQDIAPDATQRAQLAVQANQALVTAAAAAKTAASPSP